MDEIAKELGISKKTIYENFKDKDEIVKTVLEHYLVKDKEQWEYYEKQSVNAIEHLSNISRCLRRNVKEVNPTILFDLRKFHTDAWKIFVKFKHEFIFNSIVRNLKQGISEGYFRKDIIPEILATLRIEQIQQSMDSELFPDGQYSLEEIHNQFFDHFVHGLLTEKGLKLYNEINNAVQDQKSVIA